MTDFQRPTVTTARCSCTPSTASPTEGGFPSRDLSVPRQPKLIAVRIGFAEIRNLFVLTRAFVIYIRSVII